MKQIIENAGELEKFEYFDTHLLPSSGYNAKTREIVDMFEAQIVDPAIVVTNAIKTAISVAGTILTARIVVSLPTQKTPLVNNMPTL